MSVSVAGRAIILNIKGGMMFRRVVLVLVAVIIVGFIGIQFVPVQRTNPPVVTQLNWDSPQTKALVERACMDCHSNQTTWPWYAYVAPVSWLVAQDVAGGRREMNLSELDASRLNRMGTRIQRAVTNGQMPLPPYLLMHPSAKLSDAEKQALITGLTKTFAQTAAPK